MTGRDYLQHGDRHRATGTDPIPGLGGIALAVAYLWGIHGTLSVGSGVSNTAVPWNHFQTTDTSVFGTDTTVFASSPFHNTTGDKYLYLNADGLYVAAGMCQWPSGAYDQSMIIDNPGSQWVLDNLAVPTATEELLTNVGPAILGSVYGLYSSRIFYVDSTTEPGITFMNLSQTSGISKTLVDATMGVFYLGTAPDLASIY